MAGFDGSKSDDNENYDESYNERIEAVVCTCSSKQGFLKMLQISKENTCEKFEKLAGDQKSETS